MKRNICILSLAVLFMMALTGCSSSDSEKTEVHVGYFNNITHAQALYMKANGLLENELGNDADVKWIAFNAGSAEVEALFSKDIDIGYIGPVPAITATVKSNGDVKILSSATKGGAVLVAGQNSDIKSAADLSGKTVAIPQLGNTQHLSLLALLSENDLAPTTSNGDVTIAAIANADVANVMSRGDIDAALVPEPWGSTLCEQGCSIILDYDEIYMNGGYDVAVVVVRTEFMEKHPDIVEKFLKIHESVTDKINTDTEQSLKTINQEIFSATNKRLSDSVITSSFKRIEVGTEINKESIDGFALLSVENGFIKELPKEENIYVTDIK